MAFIRRLLFMRRRRGLFFHGQVLLMKIRILIRSKNFGQNGCQEK
jgi:hypothetical protein